MSSRRIRTLGGLAAALAAAALSIVAIGAPAQAARRADTIQYVVGSDGTWSMADPVASIEVPVSGLPFDGTLSGHFEPVAGVLPPWPGCVPGTGTVTVGSATATLTLALRGDLCWSVAPSGYLIFKGWHDVTSYAPEPREKWVTGGYGSFDIRLLADGSVNLFLDGRLTTTRR
jgi:hypothetical protein